MDNLQYISLLTKTYPDLDTKVDLEDGHIKISLYFGTVQGNTLGIRSYYNDLYYFESIVNNRRVHVDFNIIIVPIDVSKEVGLYYVDTFDDFLKNFEYLRDQMKKYFTYQTIRKRLIDAYNLPSYRIILAPIINKYKNLYWINKSLRYIIYADMFNKFTDDTKFIVQCDKEGNPRYLEYNSVHHAVSYQDINSILETIERLIPDLETIG